MLFNPRLAHYQQLYDLYRAIQTRQSIGEVTVKEVGENGNIKYLIEQPGVEEMLSLESTDRNALLVYLQQNYFANTNVENWYKERAKKEDKESNHQVLSDPIPQVESSKQLDVYPHRKETKYYRWKLLVRGFVYVVLVALGAVAVVSLEGVALIQLLLIFAYLLLLWIVQRLAKGYFVGLIQGNSVRVTEEQYPKIYDIVRSQAATLKLKELPEIYISYGHFNAFVMQMARSKYLMLYSEVVETSLTGDDEVLKFVIGHELGHLYRKHLTKDKWLFPANIIPLLHFAYSRGREYTCDRIGYHFSRRGAVEGVLIMTAGKEIYSKVNVEQFIESGKRSSGFWMWFSEKFRTHPHLVNRLREIKEYNRAGN